MMEDGTVKFGSTEIPYSVKYSSVKKQAGISVSPDKLVEISVPADTPEEKVREIAGRKAAWIYEQIGWFDNLSLMHVTKEYVSGETYLYLGRQYRLKIVCNGSESGVKLNGGFFEVTVPERTGSSNKKDLIRKSLLNWYCSHAEEKIEPLVDKYSDLLGIETPLLNIKYQLKRWGSCTKSGVVNINVRIAMAPMSQVEYVVVHELCHLIHREHSADFWSLVRRILPDYEIRKDRLLQMGWRYEL
jgi:predicted metal-dependent hydrolase